MSRSDPAEHRENGARTPRKHTRPESRHIDLNLLLAPHALLEERHITRAARRFFLSQPAMSRALDRLRETFGDVLLIRTGRTYERTVRGETLLRELQSLLPRLESMVRGEEFGPQRSQDDSGWL